MVISQDNHWCDPLNTSCVQFRISSLSTRNNICNGNKSPLYLRQCFKLFHLARHTTFPPVTFNLAASTEGNPKCINRRM